MDEYRIFRARPLARSRGRLPRYRGGVQPPSALDILVVDDDEPLREMLTRSFEREGHRVTAVPDGEQAIAQATERDFDVVLLDVALGPGPAGHDVARALRQRRAVVPIIMLTALDSEADVVQGLEAGADDYVTKPFGIDELLARIRTALRHRLQLQGERPLFRSGDLAVDLVRRTVRVRDAEVKLSPKEYDILRALVAHAGQVLTHKFLLKEVWGGETDPQYVRIYVRSLRQKIEADPSRPRHILTESGVGYRLCAPD
jgi:two-component system KDP operon response regulator KdpE